MAAQLRQGPQPHFSGPLAGARAYAAGSAVLMLESTSAVASRTARDKVTFGELRSPDEAIAALDAVTEDDVREAAGRIGDGPTVACVGPHRPEDFE